MLMLFYSFRSKTQSSGLLVLVLMCKGLANFLSHLCNKKNRTNNVLNFSWPYQKDWACRAKYSLEIQGKREENPENYSQDLLT